MNQMAGFFAGLPVIGGHGINAELADWAASQIPHVGQGADFGPSWCLGVVRGRALAAVVAFHDFQPSFGTAQVSMAAVTPRWATRPVVRAILGFGFDRLGGEGGTPLRKLFTITPHDNERALRFNEGIGMRREAILRHQFARGRHAVFCGMLRTEWARRYGGEGPDNR